MENPLQSALQRMGSNFLVAAFVPALGFIIAFGFAFDPIFEFSYFSRDLTQFLQINFVILLVVTVLGFTLYALSTYIYKSFEGYTFILDKPTVLRRSFLGRQQHRFKRLEAQIVEVERQLLKLTQKIERESLNTRIGTRYAKRLNRYANERELLRSHRYNLTSEKNEEFPPSFDLLLPTRFGNRLRAAEMYSATRYEIDAVPLWGRLAHVIPEEGMGKIDEANNQCLFLLNAALLTAVFTLCSLLVSFYLALAWWVATENLQLPQIIRQFIQIDSANPLLYQKGMWMYIVLTILAFVGAWFFYEASLFNVSQFGGMIRASYDLYRFDLLEALHLELPANLRAERRLWQRVSYFMVGNDQGNELREREELEQRQELSELEGIDFTYKHPDKQKTQAKPELVTKK